MYNLLAFAFFFQLPCILTDLPPEGKPRLTCHASIAAKDEGESKRCNKHVKGIENLLAASSSRIDANAAPPMVASLEQAIAQYRANHHEDRFAAEDKPAPPVEAATGIVITSEDRSVSVYTCSLFLFMRSNSATGIGIFFYTWI